MLDISSHLDVLCKFCEPFFASKVFAEIKH
jgi:hypothetical protein